jgi:hypothetical protein
MPQLVKRSPIYFPLYSYLTRLRQRRELAQWKRDGCVGAAPHLVKQKMLRDYGHTFGLNVLVETGTYLGDMVYAMMPYFSQIYSIELSQEFHERAQRRFRRCPKIKLLQGDSRQAIAAVLQMVNEPILFWLDGHYSGGVTARGVTDTPILEELGHIFEGRRLRDVILVDDARLFGVDPAYPTLDELASFVGQRAPQVQIEVRDDCIRITPRDTTHTAKIAHDAGELAPNQTPTR